MEKNLLGLPYYYTLEGNVPKYSALTKTIASTFKSRKLF